MGFRALYSQGTSQAQQMPMHSLQQSLQSELRGCYLFSWGLNSGRSTTSARGQELRARQPLPATQGAPCRTAHNSSCSVAARLFEKRLRPWLIRASYGSSSKAARACDRCGSNAVHNILTLHQPPRILASENSRAGRGQT